MDINVLASGSSGNAYIVSDGLSSILIDCGIPYGKLQEKSRFRVSRVAGCLISHEHADHCKAACELARRGVDIYTARGTIEAAGLSGHRIHEIKALSRFIVGTFNVLPFDTEHDAAEPLGFLLFSAGTLETLLYFTDTYYLRYKFKGITHIMAEANYSLDILRESIDADPGMGARRNRLLESHMSIEHLEEMLKANDLSNLKQIYLIHMSADNGDPAAFKERIQRLTGAEVYTA